MQSRSTDGVNWSDAVAIKDTLVTVADNDPNEITGIVLNSGRIFLVLRNLYYYSVYSDDNGITWSVPTKLPTGTNLINYRIAHFGSITQSSTGKLLFAYTKHSNILSIASSDNGGTWGAEQTLPLTSDTAAISTAGNKLILVYQSKGLFRSFSSDDGVTWDSPGNLIINDITINTPKIVKDQTGKLWLFYQRILPTAFQGFSQQDILYKISSDEGLSWGVENNFTTFVGYDGYYNISATGNNPLVSFSSSRFYLIYPDLNFVNLWYGTAGITNDNNAPSAFYNYVLSNYGSMAGEPFNIDAYIDYKDAAPIVTLGRIINGVTQPPLTMFDDGTHGDTIANDKIFTCQVPALSLFDNMHTQLNITDQSGTISTYNGPSFFINLAYNINATLLDVNRFKLPVVYNGVLGDFIIPPQSIGGGRYDGNIVLFSGGFYMTGKTNGTLWSNGQFTSSPISDYVQGKVGSDPNDPINRLYILKSTDPPFGQSWLDWRFAVAQGAGFYDGDHDGIYNPVDLNGNGKWDLNEDRPDLLGDMSIWCVYNDGTPPAQRFFSNVNPQGIEIQQTIFAQKDSADLNNVIFERYRIINRGTVADVLDSVYFGAVYDVDIGDNGANDLSGCDTLLNSVYTYHKTGNGDGKFGATPPAELIAVLQGPVSYIPGITFTDVNSNGIYDDGVDIPIDTAYSLGGPLIGKAIYPGAKNLIMSSANNYFKSAEPANAFQTQYTLKGGGYPDGRLFDPCSWNQGQVLGGVNCANVNPLYLFSGDPLTQTGWINTIPKDQRNLLNTGPFRLEKNKPVDILFANIVGRGSDYLNSITVAKNYTANIIDYYRQNFPNSILTGVRDLPQVINNFNLYQNYPNPFNPSTRIKYSISTSSLVSIKIYNILGKEVAILLNEQKNPGEYQLTFNSGKYNLSSGVYFYKLSAGSFTSVKKMMLLK